MKDGINTETTLRMYVQMGCEQKFNNRGGQVHVITNLVVVIGGIQRKWGILSGQYSSLVDHNEQISCTELAYVNVKRFG